MALHYTLRQLEYFVAVGEEGSIVKASRKVNVSSPSISAAVAQLEEEFGLSLFVRKHAHGLSLTQAGQQFMQQAKRVLQEASGMNRLADELSGNVQGRLKVGCLLTFAQLLVPRLRREFEAQHPKVSVSQSELDQLGLFEELRCAGIDVALSYDLDIPNDISFLPLIELPPYVMLSAEHPLSSCQSVSLKQLQEHPMVLLDLPHSAEYFLSLFERAKARPQIVERTRDMAVLRSLVANGFGYSIANIKSRDNRAPDGNELILLPIEGDPRPLKLGVVLIDEMANRRAVRAFVDHCRKHIHAELLGST